MNMTKLKRNTQNLLWTLTVLLLAISCSSDKEDAIGDQAVLSQAELQQILNTDELAGVADDIVTGLFMNSSNALTGKTNPDCYVAEYSDTGFSVTFTNCAVDGNENVNGTVMVTYTSEGETLSFTTTFDNFSVDGIEINGTRSYVFEGLVDQEAFTFTVTSDMTITLADGTVIDETGSKTFGFSFGDTLETSVFTIDGNWTVSIDENTYAVMVDTTLEGNLACDYLTSGVMQVSKNGLAVSVDFGDGSCDNIATIIYPDGTTEEVELDD
ncbi:hypothetical protein WIW50_11265 [Flavobacteriaceae bacterium 3-367]